jgi:hypothetical protein
MRDSWSFGLFQVIMRLQIKGATGKSETAEFRKTRKKVPFSVFSVVPQLILLPKRVPSQCANEV